MLGLLQKYFWLREPPENVRDPQGPQHLEPLIIPLAYEWFRPKYVMQFWLKREKYRQGMREHFLIYIRKTHFH